MGIRLKKKKGKGSCEVKRDKETVSYSELAVDIPDSLGVDNDEPHSRVSVQLGYRQSRNYQSVEVEAKVEVPVKTGKEVEGLDYAAARADVWIKANQSGIDEFLDSLS